MNFKLIVFDLAGTTLQDNEEIVASSFLNTLEKFSIHPLNKDVRWIMGFKKIEALKMLLKVENKSVDDATLHDMYLFFNEKLKQAYKNEDLSEIEGISDLFQKLKSNNIKIAINTGFDREILEIILTKLKWFESGLIDAAIASDEVSEGRPSPYMIQKLMKQFGITHSSQVIKVGDTPSDLLEGKNASCGLTIGVLYGTHSREELADYPNNKLVSSVIELEHAIFGITEVTA